MKIFLLCVFAALVSAEGDYYKEPTIDSAEEDGRLNMTQLLTKYGYPSEVHTVQTSDGYLLQVYRIPYGRKCGAGVGKKTPILVQHGLFSSSFDWIIMGPDRALGYILADECYDVWLGNSRGNSLSKGHVKLSTKNKKFWEFSWHEMGVYDVPALIDYILKKTGRSGLHYIGHSQGTTQFFVFAALRPEYHSKIISMHALSPVVFMKNLKSPPVRLLVKRYKTIASIANLIGLHEFSPQSGFLNLIGSEICKDEHPNFQIVCSNVMFLIAGFNEQQLNKTMLPAIIGHTPAGASVRQLIHYAQEIKSGKFRQFDFGMAKNLKAYKSRSPPDYSLTNSNNIPIALYYAENDWLSSVKDVKKLIPLLPNIVLKYTVPCPNFSHLDFIIANDAKKLLYDKVIDVLKQY